MEEILLQPRKSRNKWVVEKVLHSEGFGSLATAVASGGTMRYGNSVDARNPLL